MMNNQAGEIENSKAVRFAYWVMSLKAPFLFCLLASLAAGIVYPWFIAQPEYLSRVVFVPPPETQSQLNDLISARNGMISNKGDISNEQIKVLFESETFQRRIVDRFDLISRYKIESVAKYKRALKELKNNLVMDEAKSSGLGYSTTQSFEISCWDKSADTAKQICQFVFNVLDSSMVQISSNRARQILEFSAKRSQEAERQLELDQNELIRYQKVTGISEPIMQTQMMMQATAKLSEKLTESKLTKLMSAAARGEGNSDENIMNEFQRSIEKEILDLQSAKKSRLPSISSIAEGAPKYFSMLREIEIQTKLLVLLRQQEEMARLDVSKTQSSLYLIDSARVPEYKDRPKRMMLALLIVVSGVMMFSLGAIYVFVSKEFFSKNAIFRSMITGKSGQ